MDARKDILRGPGLKIVIIAWKNTAELRELGFKPKAVIIDDIGACVEPDIYGPLGLLADRVLMGAGDTATSKPKICSEGNL
jgi:hypothetical protein